MTRSHQLYEAVDRLLKMSTQARSIGEDGNIYTGFIRCGNWGQKMIQRQVAYDNRKYYYYICSSGNKKPSKCTACRISKSALEKILFAQIQNHVNEALCIHEMIPQIDISAIQEACLNRASERIDRFNNQLVKYQYLLGSLDDSYADGLLTETECVEYRRHYTKKCYRLDCCVASALKKSDRAISENDLFDWTELYIPFIPFEKITRPFLAYFVSKIIIDEKKGVYVIFIYEDKLRMLRPFVSAKE